MGRVMQLAAFSLAEVTYATGDISYMIQESVAEASFRVQARQENVSGTILPAFEAVRTQQQGDAQNGGAAAGCVPSPRGPPSPRSASSPSPC